MEVFEIQSDLEYQRAVEIMESCNTAISQAYSQLEKITDKSVIIEFQDFISKLISKRNGLYKLIDYYNYKNKPTDENDLRYIVKDGDTLVILSQAFYQNPDYAQYIYYYNDLDSFILQRGMELKIPEIHPSQPPVLAQYQIEFIESEK